MPLRASAVHTAIYSGVPIRQLTRLTAISKAVIERICREQQGKRTVLCLKRTVPLFYWDINNKPVMLITILMIMHHMTEENVSVYYKPFFLDNVQYLPDTV